MDYVIAKNSGDIGNDANSCFGVRDMKSFAHYAFIVGLPSSGRLRSH